MLGQKDSSGFLQGLFVADRVLGVVFRLGSPLENIL